MCVLFQETKPVLFYASGVSEISTNIKKLIFFAVFLDYLWKLFYIGFTEMCFGNKFGYVLRNHKSTVNMLFIVVL